MQTVVKKWFQDKDCGILDNGEGPDIMVRKAELVNCQFLKIGATVEFECHPGKKGLFAKKVRLSSQKRSKNQHKGKPGVKEFRPGVMT